jgi:hypothetical protein
MAKSTPHDPAWGRSKAQRALGNYEDEKTTFGSKTARSKQWNQYGTRQINNGQFSGPRPSYGRYQVSEQAQDILNRSKRTMNREY